MLCSDPFMKGGALFPCGQCMPCRFNRRREWTHRIMLEAHQYKANAFLTLTYSDLNLPRTSEGLPTLNPKHLQDWLKRLRKVIAPSRLRFYACGEYGDTSWRPHYHVALFNYEACLHGRTRQGRNRVRCCRNCDPIAESWGHGGILLGSLSPESAQYIAGYVTKKLTKSGDPALQGRFPEFARMSNRPGIGADAMHEVASALLIHDLVEGATDVPSALRHGSKELPLGRYLKRRLRKLVGRDEKATPEAQSAAQEKLRPLQALAFETSQSFKKVVVDHHESQRAAQANRQHIRRKRTHL